MRHFSGRGPTSECVVKPDILAAGCNVVSALSNSPELAPERLRGLRRVGEHYVKMSGTSMASPAVAGAISLLLERQPHLTPNEVKLFIKQTARDLRLPPNRQGWGVLDLMRWGL